MLSRRFRWPSTRRGDEFRRRAARSMPLAGRPFRSAAERTPCWAAALRPRDDYDFTSADILARLACGDGPRRYFHGRFYLVAAITATRASDAHTSA